MLVFIVGGIFAIIILSFHLFERSRPTNSKTPTKPSVIPDLEGVLMDAVNMKNTTNIYFAGGTLCIDNIFNFPIISITLENCTDFTGNLKRKTTVIEKYLFSKIYVEYKTPKHCFYDECLSFIEDYSFVENPIIM
jgi:hypothetical protein